MSIPDQQPARQAKWNGTEDKAPLYKRIPTQSVDNLEHRSPPLGDGRRYARSGRQTSVRREGEQRPSGGTRCEELVVCLQMCFGVIPLVWVQSPALEVSPPQSHTRRFLRWMCV